MKIVNLNKKVTNEIFEVSIENACDSVQGYYTEKQEAIEKANKEFGLVNRPIHVILYVWSEDEDEYIPANSLDPYIDSTVAIIE